MKVVSNNGFTLEVDYQQLERDEHPLAHSGVEIGYLGTSRYVLGTKGMSEAEMRAIESDDEYVWDPVYAYVHSGTALRSSTTGKNPFSCPWDSGRSGIIFALKHDMLQWVDAEEMTPDAREAISEVFSSLTEEFTSFLNGEVYEYTVYDKRGDPVDGRGGFCDRDEAESEGRLALEACEEEYERSKPLCEACGDKSQVDVVMLAEHGDRNIEEFRVHLCSRCKSKFVNELDVRIPELCSNIKEEEKDG